MVKIANQHTGAQPSAMSSGKKAKSRANVLRESTDNISELERQDTPTELVASSQGGLEEELLASQPPKTPSTRKRKTSSAPSNSQTPARKSRKVSAEDTRPGSVMAWKSKVQAQTRILEESEQTSLDQPEEDADLMLCLERLYQDTGSSLQRISVCLEVIKSYLEYFPPVGRENEIYSKRLIDCLAEWIGIFKPCVLDDLELEFEEITASSGSGAAKQQQQRKPNRLPDNGNPAFWYCLQHLYCCLLDKSKVVNKPRMTLTNLGGNVTNHAEVIYYSNIKKFLNEYLNLSARVHWIQQLQNKLPGLISKSHGTPDQKRVINKMTAYMGILNQTVTEPLDRLKINFDKGSMDFEDAHEGLEQIETELDEWEKMAYPRLRAEEGIIVREGFTTNTRSLFETTRPNQQIASIDLGKFVLFVNDKKATVARSFADVNVQAQAVVSVSPYKFVFECAKQVETLLKQVTQVKNTVFYNPEYSTLVDKICELYEEEDHTQEGDEQGESLLPEEVPLDLNNFDERRFSRAEIKQYINNRQSLLKTQTGYRSTGIYNEPRDLKVDDNGQLSQEVSEGLTVQVSSNIPPICYSVRMPVRPAIPDEDLTQALLLPYITGCYDYKQTGTRNTIHNFSRGLMVRVDLLHQEPFIEFAELIAEESKVMGFNRQQWFVTVNTNWIEPQMESHGYDKETFQQRVQDALGHFCYSYFDSSSEFSIKNLINWEVKYLNVEVGSEQGKVHAHCLLEVAYVYVDEDDKTPQLKVSYPAITGFIKQQFLNAYVNMIPVKQLIHDDDMDREERIRKYCEKNTSLCSVDHIAKNSRVNPKRKTPGFK